MPIVNISRTGQVEIGELVSLIDNHLYFSKGSGNLIEGDFNIETIPFQSDALFWLNGEIIDVGESKYFKDQLNDKHFLITGYDFDTAWTIGMPYKSAATISAPADDAALIAADINNYLYAADGTPNQIPVVSLFQDVDYEHKLFCRHAAQIVDENGVETSEPRVLDIVLYGNIKATTDLTTCQTYFGVPTEDANSYWVDAVNGSDTAPGDGSKAHPWATLVKAVSTVTDGKVIYLKTGNVLTSGYLNDTRDHNVIGLGLVITTPDGATNGLAISRYSEVFNGVYSKPSVNATRNIYPSASALSIVLSKMYLSATGGGAVSGTAKEFKWNVIKGTYITGINFSGIPVNQDIDTNYANVIESAGYFLIVAASGICNIKNNKMIVNGSFSYLAMLGAVNIFGNYFEGNGNFSVRNDGLVDIHHNVIKMNSLNLPYNNNTNISHIRNNTFINTLIDSDCPALIENNLLTFTENGGLIGFTLSAANNIQSAIIRNNTLISSENRGGYVIGSDSSNSADGKVTLSLFEMNKLISNGSPHGCLMGYQHNPVARYNKIVVAGGYGFVMEGKYGQAEWDSGGIYGNIVKSDFRLVVTNMDGLKIYNNTMISSSVEPIATYASQSHTVTPINCKIKNNIIISLSSEANCRVIAFESATNEVDYNIYYSPNTPLKFKIGATYYTFGEWQALGFDTHSIVLTEEQFNGLFTDFVNGDYSLKNDSLAIGSGVALDAAYDDGLDTSTEWGADTDLPIIVTKQQGANWDVGAYVH